jgi:hypothetical protein
VVAIWPALWVHPAGVVQQLLADLRSETSINVFRADDPGWAFYPRVLAWRFSPLLQAGAGRHRAGSRLAGRASPPSPCGV